MAAEAQRILIIQDGSRRFRTEGVDWALGNLSVKAGDMLRLFRVVPSFMVRAGGIPSIISCGLLGSKSSNSTSPKSFSEKRDGSKLVHSSQTIRKRKETIENEIAIMQAEILSNVEIKKLQKQTDAEQIDFDTIVEAGNSLKEFTVHAAMEFQATTVILERHMKRDVKYLMNNLSCGIIRMRYGDIADRIREPQAARIEPIIPFASGENSIASTSGHKQQAVITCQTSRDSRGQELIRPLGNILRQPEEEEEEMASENSLCSNCGHSRHGSRFVKEYPYADLAHSTRRFSQKNLLSKGEKRTYKGVLKDGLRIVVKKHTLENKSREDFRSLVQTLVMARNENVVTLLGSCIEGDDRYLVYEYACNGSLSTHLSERSKELTWEKRWKIGMGTAKGLEFLHRSNLYGSVTPSSILLTHDYQPLVANFGLTRNRYEDLDHSSETRVLRTFDYLPTEYGETGTDSSKMDVFSLGVLLLQLITGQKTAEDTHGNTYLRWARPLVKHKMYDKLIDPTLLDYDLHQLLWMVRIVERCISFKPENRCSVQQVMTVLTDVTKGRLVTDFPPLEPEI